MVVIVIVVAVLPVLVRVRVSPVRGGRRGGGGVVPVSAVVLAQHTTRVVAMGRGGRGGGRAHVQNAVSIRRYENPFPGERRAVPEGATPPRSWSTAPFLSAKGGSKTFLQSH